MYLRLEDNGSECGHSACNGWPEKCEDEYKDSDMLPKINKSVMAGMMEAIKEYLRSCHGDVWAPQMYIIRKTITVQIYGNYPMYATPEDKMINLPQR